MGQLLDKLRMDLAWRNLVDGKPVPVRWGRLRVLCACCTRRGLLAIFLHRLAYRRHVKGHRFRAAIWTWLAFQLCGVDISPAAEIEGGLRLPHAQGVVIGARVRVGQMVTINQHTTLGGNFGKRDEAGRWWPRIGDWCWIAAGSVVAGPITVGEGAIIGANAIVVEDVPAHAVVGGGKAKVIRIKEPQVDSPLPPLRQEDI